MLSLKSFVLLPCSLYSLFGGSLPSVTPLHSPKNGLLASNTGDFNAYVASRLSQPATFTKELKARVPLLLPRANMATGKYTIVAGDTYYAIAQRLGAAISILESLNPNVSPMNLQVGQVINIPSSSSSASSIPPQTPVSSVCSGTSYCHYSGPASAFPNPNLWASYATLWATNSQLMSYNDAAAEITEIGNAIQTYARQCGIDARAILCLIMQESGGNVRVKSTSSWQGVHNTGIMQAHNGSVFSASNPVGSILQMVKDGTMGTSSGDGLLQCLQHQVRVRDFC